MPEDPINKQAHALTGVALRYPEKTLFLGQVFNDTTNSYKFLWYLAILSLLRKGNSSLVSMADVFTEMAIIAWHPVSLYRLSLGRLDTLQEVVRHIALKSGLQPNATPDAVRKFINGCDEAKTRLAYFKRHVPTRFLSPWFADKLRGAPDYQRDSLIEQLAKDSQKTPFATPYFLDGKDIRINDSWRTFLVENMSVMQAFGEYHLAIYLQARNPNVPGVVNKLHAPTERQLTTAREFWQLVRAEFEKSGNSKRFCDIYTDQPLGESFAIDHFLPWSFVVHDLLWNLTPVGLRTNSSKSDALPDLNLYLPRLAKLHFRAIEIAKKRPKLAEDYTDCFKQDTAGLLALGEDGFTVKYREVMVPLAQIAVNQGFPTDWRFRI